MSSAWGVGLYDNAAWNTAQVEEIPLFDYQEMLGDEADCEAWDKEINQDLDELLFTV